LHHLAPIAAAFVAGLLALTACQGSSIPSPSPSPTVSSESPAPDASKPTPASSTGPARNIPVPKLPEAATANTKAGFEAFAKYWMSLTSYAYETGDTKPAAKIQGPLCSTCNAVVNDVRAINSKGHWSEGGKSTLTLFETDFEPMADGAVSAWVTYHQDELIVYGAPAKPIQTIAANDSVAPIEMIAKFESGAWKVVELGKPKGSR